MAKRHMKRCSMSLLKKLESKNYNDLSFHTGQNVWVCVCVCMSVCVSHSVVSDSLLPHWQIFQARILERVAMPSSRGSSWPRDRTWVSCITGGLFTHWATWEALGLRGSESNQSKESNFLNLSLVFQRMNTHLAAHLSEDLNIF